MAAPHLRQLLGALAVPAFWSTSSSCCIRSASPTALAASSPRRRGGCSAARSVRASSRSAASPRCAARSSTTARWRAAAKPSGFRTWIGLTRARAQPACDSAHLRDDLGAWSPARHSRSCATRPSRGSSRLHAAHAARLRGAGSAVSVWRAEPAARMRRLLSLPLRCAASYLPVLRYYGLSALRAPTLIPLVGPVPRHDLELGAALLAWNTLSVEGTRLRTTSGTGAPLPESIEAMRAILQCSLTRSAAAFDALPDPESATPAHRPRSRGCRTALIALMRSNDPDAGPARTAAVTQAACDDDARPRATSPASCWDATGAT